MKNLKLILPASLLCFCLSGCDQFQPVKQEPITPPVTVTEVTVDFQKMLAEALAEARINAEALADKETVDDEANAKVAEEIASVEEKVTAITDRLNGAVESTESTSDIRELITTLIYDAEKGTGNESFDDKMDDWLKKDSTQKILAAVLSGADIIDNVQNVENLEDVGIGIAEATLPFLGGGIGAIGAGILGFIKVAKQKKRADNAEIAVTQLVGGFESVLGGLDEASTKSAKHTLKKTQNNTTRSMVENARAVI